MRFCGCVSLAGAHFFLGKGSIMDQRPHTESEAVEREPNQSDTTEEQQEVSEDVGIGQTSKRSSHKTRRIGIIVSAIVIGGCSHWRFRPYILPS